MSEWMSLAESWIQAWSQAQWRVVGQGSLGLLAVWLACRFWPGLPARVQCWLWRLAYLKLLVCLFWTQPVSLPLLAPPAAPEPLLSTPATPPVALQSLPAGLVLAPLPSPPGSGPNPQSFPPVSEPPALLNPDWQTPARGEGEDAAGLDRDRLRTFLFVFWLAGVGAVGWIQVRAWRRFRRLARRARPLSDPAWQEDLQRLCARLGVHAPPDLRDTPDLTSPVLTGTLRPVILIPQSWERRCEPEPRRMMLAHELAHWKRRDLVWNCLPAVAGALFFFHPLVWWFLKDWRLAQEMACDEEAVLGGGLTPAGYGSMLLGVATVGLWRAPAAAPVSMFSAGIVESKQTLKRRIRAMKMIRKMSLPRLVLWAGLTLCTAGLILVPWRLTAQEALEKEEFRRNLQEDPGEGFERERSVDTDRKERPGGRERRAPESVREREIRETRGGGLDGREEDFGELAGEGLFEEGDRRSRRLHVERRDLLPALALADPNLGGSQDREVLQAQLEAAEAELAYAQHRLERLAQLSGQNLVAEEELVKARAEAARAKAQVAMARARSKSMAARRAKPLHERDVYEDQSAEMEHLRRQVEELKQELERVRGAGGGGYGGGFEPAAGLNSLAPRNGAGFPGGNLSREQRDRQRELIQEEIGLARQQLELQQARVRAGQGSEEEVLARRREILALEREKIRLE